MICTDKTAKLRKGFTSATLKMVVADNRYAKTF